jgi:biopolymer transport protein ExbD
VFTLKRLDSGETLLYLNENSIDEAGVRKLFEFSQPNEDQPVSLSADQGIPYGEVMTVIDLLESVGLKKLSLDTRHVEPR